MFKICNDKTYYVVQTTSEDVVVEIYTKKDGRGSNINLHEMHLDLCRAIRKLQHDGYTIMKVYPAMGDRRESIDVLSITKDCWMKRKHRCRARNSKSSGRDTFEEDLFWKICMC